jgi:hypothetical protein
MQKTNYLSWQGHKNQVCRMRQEKKFSTFAYVIPLEFSIGCRVWLSLNGLVISGAVLEG